MALTAKELAAHYGVDRRTVTNWLNSDPPCPSWKDGNARLFDGAKVAEWKEARAVADALSAISRKAPEGLEEAELRKAVADALLAEIRVAKEEGSLIPLEVHERVVGEMGDRLMGVLTALPDTFAIRLEQLEVAPRDARAVLESVQEELVRALRGVADAGDDPPQD